MLGKCAPSVRTRRTDDTSVNLIGLAADASVLGTAHTSFMSQSCGEEQTNWPYIDPPELYYDWKSLGFNLYRIPVAWGHIQEGLYGPLNKTTLNELDIIMERITSNGSTAILDIVCPPSARFSKPLIALAQLREILLRRHRPAHRKPS